MTSYRSAPLAKLPPPASLSRRVWALVAVGSNVWKSLEDAQELIARTQTVQGVPEGQFKQLEAMFHHVRNQILIAGGHAPRPKPEPRPAPPPARKVSE